MTDVPPYVWLGVLLAVLHILLCEVLLRILRKESPDEYRAIGEPHLTLNNTPRTAWLFWKWMLTARGHSDRFSPRIRHLVLVVWVLTLLFVVWFAGGVIGVFLGRAGAV